MVRRIIGDDVNVGVRLAPNLPAVEADRAQIERVILNLAANARDAMPHGGRLTIETAAVELDEDYVSSRGEGTPGANVLLAVSDTGVGMSEEVQRHLFEPFFTTKAPGAGTGLGLATVFGVVKQSGGSIYVYSEEGRGTTFKIYLPAATGAAEPAAGADGAAELGSETVMLVEDDESVRNLVRTMLETKGYRVLAAAGADEAERLCTENNCPVDLLLTDVVMPEVNGRVLAERLSERSPSLRILFMSGYSDEAVYRHGEISPNASFIEKPFTVADIDRELVAGLVVRDGHDDLVVGLAPEEPHVDAVACTVVEFAECVVHGDAYGPIHGGIGPWGESRQTSGAGPCARSAESRTSSSACAGLSFSRASSWPNQPARSTSGNSCIRPDRGGHSIVNVLLVIASASRSPAAAYAVMTLPLF